MWSVSSHTVAACFDPRSGSTARLSERCWLLSPCVFNFVIICVALSLLYVPTTSPSCGSIVSKILRGWWLAGCILSNSSSSLSFTGYWSGGSTIWRGVCWWLGGRRSRSPSVRWGLGGSAWWWSVPTGLSVRWELSHYCHSTSGFYLHHTLDVDPVGCFPSMVGGYVLSSE